MIKKRFAAFFIIFIFVSSSFLPIFAPRAHAIFGIGDLVIDVEALAREFVDGAAMILAQRLVDQMVQSSVDWANNGFDGGPAFVTDPAQFLRNTADQAAGSFINSSSVGFLCSPIQGPQIKIALAQYYNSQYRNYTNSCTLTGVTGNIENFYQDFNNGGWDAWFSMTQQNSNNPYGSYLDAQIQLDKRVASVLGIQNKKLDWSQGFKSKGDCIAYNPSAQQITDYENGVSGPGTIADGQIKYDDTQPADACITYGPDKTPGSIIKSQLDKVLPSGLDKLITVNHVEQLVTAFTQGLLTKYVFGSTGLFSNNSGGGSSPGGTYSDPIVPPTLLCFASTQLAIANQDPVTWGAIIANNTGSVSYRWDGQDIDRASTFNPGGYATGESFAILYRTPGFKTMRVTATTNDSGGKPVTIGPVDCRASVEIQMAPIATSTASTTP